MAYKKVTREQIASYLDVTPESSSASWKIIGVGITDYGQNYNPQVTTEKWIIHKNATSSLDSYQIQGDVSQSCYFGDDVYDFVNNLRRTAGVGAKCETHILDIDLYDAETVSQTTKYKATQYDCMVAITSYATGENPVIGYSIYYNGDPKVGTVTITDGTPVFTEG